MEKPLTHKVLSVLLYMGCLSVVEAVKEPYQRAPKEVPVFTIPVTNRENDAEFTRSLDLINKGEYGNSVAFLFDR